jgi:hypothetical protein
LVASYACVLVDHRWREHAYRRTLVSATLAALAACGVGSINSIS